MIHYAIFTVSEMNWKRKTNKNTERDYGVKTVLSQSID